MKVDKRFDIVSSFKIGLLLTIDTIKRLLLSQKVLWIIVLCLIPAIILGLWRAGVFETEAEEDPLNNVYGNIPDLEEVATEQDIQVEIDDIELRFMEPDQDRIIYDLILYGTTIGNVDHLSIKIYLYFTQELPINIMDWFNNTTNGLLIGPLITDDIEFIGEGPGGNNDWSKWSFTWRNLFFNTPQPQNNMNSDNDFDRGTNNELLMFRLGFYIRAYADNITQAEKWNFDYKESFIETRGGKITYFGTVGEVPIAEEDSKNGYEVFLQIAGPMFFMFIIPLSCILYANSAVREDIENHTIVYLITRPISKTEIIFFKFKGFFISTWIPILISICISYIITASVEGPISIHLDYLVTVILIMTLNILVYGALFFMFSIATPYPIVISLLYWFIWETIISPLSSVLNRFSVTYHIQSIQVGMLGKISNVNPYLPLPVTHSTITLCCVIIVFFVIGAYIYNYRDFH